MSLWLDPETGERTGELDVEILDPAPLGLPREIDASSGSLSSYLALGSGEGALPLNIPVVSTGENAASSTSLSLYLGSGEGDLSGNLLAVLSYGIDSSPASLPSSECLAYDVSLYPAGGSS